MNVFDLDNSPARNLSGKILDGKWLVKERILRPSGHSGGVYSVCYKVIEVDGDSHQVNSDEICFLKAYDLMVYLKKNTGGNIFELINRMTGQFEYEKKLSELCRDHFVTKVACVDDSGETNIDFNGLSIPVPYLIFELADGDVHEFLDMNHGIENAWKFKSLHDIAVGLKQLHAINIYHQDVKPSNILTYANAETKIGDLGRSIKEGSNCPFINDAWWGDKTYLPPEISYSSKEITLKERMLLTDHYLLGSLIVFYFYSYTYNSKFYDGLPDILKPENTTLTYPEVKAYLINRYEEMMQHLKETMSFGDEKIDNRFFQLIGYLCHPDIDLRHRPGNKSLSLHQKYSLESVISDLQYLHRLTKYKLKK